MAELMAGVEAMGDWEFFSLALVLAVLTGVGFYLWKKSFQHARIMEDTPTSKIRSAAQGFVELVGTQHGLQDAEIAAPLTGRACTWWSYRIEKKRTVQTSKGARTEWVTVENDVSVGFFHLRDETGEILVNPLGADVTASDKKVWYGTSRRPVPGEPPRTRLLGRRYRYTERIMRPGEPIYALGHFETWSYAPSTKERSEKRAKILAEWKENPAELVRRFDEDGDGRVGVDEWERAREAAEALVEEHVAREAGKPEVDVLMKPEEAHPFILSVKSQEELAKAYRWRAVGALLLFLVGGAALGVTLTARFGG